MGRLDNKISIITGAGQGIGEVMAHIFVQEGSKVVLSGRTLSKVERVKNEILRKFPDAQVIAVFCDITDKKDIDNLLITCEKELGVPNVLINNAGMNVFHEPLETSQIEWDKCINNDLTGAWNVSRAILPKMIEKKDGAIVNISSVHGHKVIPHCFPYPIAKHGLNGLTKALAVEYAQYNIRINSISPGLIETPMSAEWYQAMVNAGKAESVEECRKKQADILPCKRIGTSEEVAMVAVMLASDEVRYINGTDIVIDGGRSILYHD